MCTLCDVCVMFGVVQRGSISRLLTKINEAEGMMNQVCVCTCMHICIPYGAKFSQGTIVTVEDSSMKNAKIVLLKI